MVWDPQRCREPWPAPLGLTGGVWAALNDGPLARHRHRLAGTRQDLAPRSERKRKWSSIPC